MRLIAPSPSDAFGSFFASQKAEDTCTSKPTSEVDPPIACCKASSTWVRSTLWYLGLRGLLAYLAAFEPASFSICRGMRSLASAGLEELDRLAGSGALLLAASTAPRQVRRGGVNGGR